VRRVSVDEIRARRVARQQKTRLLERLAHRRDPEGAVGRRGRCRRECQPVVRAILGIDLAAGKDERA
jgi:hypothetical protein